MTLIFPDSEQLNTTSMRWSRLKSVMHAKRAPVDTEELSTKSLYVVEWNVPSPSLRRITNPGWPSGDDQATTLPLTMMSRSESSATSSSSMSQTLFTSMSISYILVSPLLGVDQLCELAKTVMR